MLVRLSMSLCGNTADGVIAGPGCEQRAASPVPATESNAASGSRRPPGGLVRDASPGWRPARPSQRGPAHCRCRSSSCAGAISDDALTIGSPRPLAFQIRLAVRRRAGGLPERALAELERHDAGGPVRTCRGHVQPCPRPSLTETTRVAAAVTHAGSHGSHGLHMILPGARRSHEVGIGLAAQGRARLRCHPASPSRAI